MIGEALKANPNRGNFRPGALILTWEPGLEEEFPLVHEQGTLGDQAISILRGIESEDKVTFLSEGDEARLGQVPGRFHPLLQLFQQRPSSYKFLNSRESERFLTKSHNLFRDGEGKLSILPNRRG